MFSWIKRRVVTFNSLCEIPCMVLVSHLVELCTFNSLCEIRLFKAGALGGLLNCLSILCVRFSVHLNL